MSLEQNIKPKRNKPLLQR